MSDAQTALLEACLKALQERGESDREVMEEIGKFRASLKEVQWLRDDIKFILKIVRDGNGKPSLMSRVDALESGIAAVLKSRDLDAQSNGRTWDRWVTLACAAIAAAAAVYAGTH